MYLLTLSLLLNFLNFTYLVFSFFTLSVKVTALSFSKHYMIILSLTIKSFERVCMRGNIKIN